MAYQEGCCKLSADIAGISLNALSLPFCQKTVGYTDRVLWITPDSEI